MIVLLGNRSLCAGFVAALSLLVLTGCAGEESPSEAPYAQEFAEALAAAPNDYQRSILEDGEITQAELVDARSRVVECIVSSGMGISARYIEDPSGQFVLESEVSGSFSAEQDKVVSGCQWEWMGLIDGLYWATVTNPNNDNWDDLVADCLVRRGLVPQGFRGEDYAELVTEWFEQYGSRYIPPAGYEPEPGEVISGDQLPDGWTCEGWCSTAEPPPLVLPGGATWDDPEVDECRFEPRG